MYFVYVYYSFPRECDSEGYRIPHEGPSSELWATARTLQSAKARARRASDQNRPHEFSVEGGKYEPGDWTNPLFKNGEQLR